MLNTIQIICEVFRYFVKEFLLSFGNPANTNLKMQANADTLKRPQSNPSLP